MTDFNDEPAVGDVPTPRDKGQASGFHRHKSYPYWHPATRWHGTPVVWGLLKRLVQSAGAEEAQNAHIAELEELARGAVAALAQAQVDSGRIITPLQQRIVRLETALDGLLALTGPVYPSSQNNVAGWRCAICRDWAKTVEAIDHEHDCAWVAAQKARRGKA